MSADTSRVSPTTRFTAKRPAASSGHTPPIHTVRTSPRTGEDAAAIRRLTPFASASGTYAPSANSSGAARRADSAFLTVYSLTAPSSAVQVGDDPRGVVEGDPVRGAGGCGGGHRSWRPREQDHLRRLESKPVGHRDALGRPAVERGAEQTGVAGQRAPVHGDLARRRSIAVHDDGPAVSAGVVGPAPDRRHLGRAPVE